MRRTEITYPNGQIELRDALATDWIHFLNQVLPEALWIPLPNVGPKGAEIVQDLSITGLILSGGESFGIYPPRDETEKALLSWAAQNKLPVLGICRGAQMLQILQGGLKPKKISGHVGTRHKICYTDGKVREVNSFHTEGLALKDLHSDYIIDATTEDELWVEAFHHKNYPWKGIMWHPEREKFLDEDKDIISSLFRGDLWE